MGYTLRAVVVGVNTYQDKHSGVTPLSFARADAEEMARVLALSNTFRVEKLELHPNEFATQDIVLRSLQNVFPSNFNFDSQTISLFYFAGHGMKNPIDDSIVLCCHDADFSNPYRGGIRLNQIYDLLLKSSAGCSIAIIDACFSGGIVDLKHIDYDTPVQEARKAIATLRGGDDKTIAIFASCRTDQKAREERSRGHGVYTAEILRGWRDGEARDDNGTVDIFGLAAFLSKRFAEDKQGPRSTVLGGRPIPLWQHDPRTPGTPREPVGSLKSRHTLLDVSGRNEIPIGLLPELVKRPGQVKQQQKRIKSLAIPIIVATVALLACGLATIFLEPLRLGFFAIIFVLGILLPTLSFGINRVFGTLLTLFQLTLLVGFAYHYFHWGVGITLLAIPLGFLAGLEWLFWVLMGIETTTLIGLVVLALMS